MNHSDIKILPFTGKNIKAYLPSIARLRMEILREYPFLQAKKTEEEMRALRKYAQAPEAIVVIVFDGSAIVGASTGLPFNRESAELQKPFIDRHIDPSDYFFFSESLLLKPYRGRGIAHHFFDLREQHAQSCNQFKHICFCSINRPQDDPKRPEDHLPLNNFWRKRGFTEHPDLHCSLNWKDITDKKPSSKRGTFWIRTLV
jgi:hypothetical protein